MLIENTLANPSFLYLYKAIIILILGLFCGGDWIVKTQINNSLLSC